MYRQSALFFIFLFCISAYAETEPSGIGSIFADFSTLPYSPPSEGRVLFFDGGYYIGYNLNRCEPLPLENRIFYSTSDGAYEYKNSVEYIPNSTCSGRTTQGAGYLQISRSTLGPDLNNLYSIDLNLYMPGPIAATVTRTQTDLFTGLPVSIRSNTFPVFEGVELRLSLSDIMPGPPEEAPPSNIASCSTNLGRIVLREPNYNPETNRTHYEGLLSLNRSDVEGREEVPLSIRCNRPIASIVASGATSAYNYSPDGQFPGGATRWEDPSLILNANVGVQSSSSEYILKKTVIDPSTGSVVTGDESPVPIEPSYLTPPASAGCKYKPEVRNRRIVILSCLNKQTGQPVSGCQASLRMAIGDRHGGHTHETENRPLGSFFPNSTNFAIPAPGYAFTYEAPEVAGNIQFSFTGTGPGGAALDASPLTFDIRNSIEFVKIQGLGWNITSGHMGDYGTPLLQEKLSAALIEFESVLRRDLGAPVVAPTVVSGGASLITGGIFDIAGGWKSPHCGHRDGMTLDLSARRLNPAQQDALKEALEVYKFKFNKAESPEEFDTHWHAYLKGTNEN